MDPTIHSVRAGRSVRPGAVAKSRGGARRTASLIAGGAALAMLMLAGCGGAPTAPQAPTASPPIGTAPAPPSAGSTAEESSPDARALQPPTSQREIEVKRATESPALVTGVRFAGHPGFDRVVIDLRHAVPGYSVRWVDEFVQDGSGKIIKTRGKAYLQVALSPANAHTETGDSTWTGGPVYPTGLTNVLNVVRIGDFEAVVGVGLALNRRAGFRVFSQSSPDRLVIDVAH